MNKNVKSIPVSVIVPMRNSSTTVLKTLKSILWQKYPVAEIIVIDNASEDDSVKKVRDFQKKNKLSKIRLVVSNVNKGVGASYNVGIHLAKTHYVICMHSDSILPTKYEFYKLLDPIYRDPSVVATYSYITLPMKIWESYPFWEKCLLATSVGKEKAGMNGKLDCLNKNIFISIGGFDDIHFGHDIFIGGEDGDLHARLSDVGHVVCSEARVIHLHTLDSNYRFSDWIANRKLLARSYGRFVRMQWSHLSFKAILFAVKPSMIAMTFILPAPISVLLFFIFAFITMPAMYTNILSRKDARILLLPFITIFLVYYETFWMLESFLFLGNK